MRDTMRDILNKLYSIVSESQLNPRDPKGDYEAKKQALDDLEADPVAEQDPEISAAIDQRRADLEKEAQSAGIFEVGDDFGISFSEDLEIATEIVDILEDGIVIELDDLALEMLANEGLQFLEGELEEGVAGPKKCWKGYRKTGTQPGTGKNAGKRVNDCEKIKEDNIDEAKSYGTLPSDVLRKLYGAYQETSDGVEQHQDQEGAKRIYDALKAVADENGAQSELRSLMNAASHSAHMDFDTNPGDFKNWFPYVGELLQAIIRIHNEKEKEPDTELDDSINKEAKYQGREVPLGKKMAGDVKKSKVYVRKPNGNIVKVNFGDRKMRIKKSNPARRKSFRARHNCKNPGPRWKARYWSCRSW